ncbi:MAG TPA: winged helix DNA-binding domain-containing protein [Thermoplasmata archaeon]|nr:winged helix DNA-binding domain-containing protein [Thermoplasmata archaeon]
MVGFRVTNRRDRPFFTPAQIAAFRVKRHHLDRRAPRGRLADVVGDVCGVQAQVASMARIALWARIRPLTIDDVQGALVQRRTIVKTWSLRGALHLHPSRELPAVLGALMPTRLAYHQRWIRGLGLKEEETTALVLKALEDGPLTRDQLAEYLAKRLPAKWEEWTDGGWGRKTEGSSLSWHLVRPAVVRGLVCFGPNAGQEITFARVDRWLHDPPSMPTEQAEEALVRRYLQSFGPADAHDLRMWSGIHMRPIRATMERLGDELVEVDRDGRRGFLLAKDLPDLGRGRGDHETVRLLPSFDPFLLGHDERSHLVDRAHYARVYKDAGWLAPVVLVDGRVAGAWSYQRTPRKLELDVKMFNSLSKELRTKVEEEAHELSRFLETPDVALRFLK